MNGKYCYSWNGESYFSGYDSEQEAIEDALIDKPNAKYVYIGTCTVPKLRWRSNEEEIIESIIDILTDDVGEASENFEVNAEDEKELAKMIDETVEKWIEKNKISPSCFMVLDGRKIELKNGGNNNE